jgi:hypothetical protein
MVLASESKSKVGEGWITVARWLRAGIRVDELPFSIGRLRMVFGVLIQDSFNNITK